MESLKNNLRNLSGWRSLSQKRKRELSIGGEKLLKLLRSKGAGGGSFTRNLGWSRKNTQSRVSATRGGSTIKADPVLGGSIRKDGDVRKRRIAITTVQGSSRNSREKGVREGGKSSTARKVRDIRARGEGARDSNNNNEGYRCCPSRRGGSRRGIAGKKRLEVCKEDDLNWLRMSFRGGPTPD